MRRPLLIVTGFLGSGKTTLLRRLLTGGELQCAYLLVNEVAEVGVDHELLQHDGGVVRLLSDGCACCSGRERFREALLDIVENDAKSEDSRPIIVETSGIADPGPLIAIIAENPRLDAGIKLMGVVTLVDCVNGLDVHEEHPEFDSQIVCADLVVLTKTDMVDAHARDRIVELIGAINPGAEWTTNQDPNLARRLAMLSPLRSFETEKFTRPAGLATSRQANAGIKSFCISIEQACDWTAFAIWLSLLIHAHGSAILRIKGIMNVGEGSPPVLINCVRRTVHFPEHLGDRAGSGTVSTLVFIVRGLEPEAVLLSMKTFLKSDAPKLAR